eukprot:401973-Prymnesium_polylepis.1
MPPRSDAGALPSPRADGICSGGSAGCERSPGRDLSFSSSPTPPYAPPRPPCGAATPPAPPPPPPPPACLRRAACGAGRPGTPDGSRGGGTGSRG